MTIDVEYLIIILVKRTYIEEHGNTAFGKTVTVEGLDLMESSQITAETFTQCKLMQVIILIKKEKMVGILGG